MQGANYSCFATCIYCDLLNANQVYISTSKPRTKLDFNTLCDLIESLNSCCFSRTGVHDLIESLSSCWICRTECAPHASFTALGSECQKPFLHVANTMIALQFCDQGGASSATLLHAGRKLFLLCDMNDHSATSLKVLIHAGFAELSVHPMLPLRLWGLNVTNHSCMSQIP